ncbi:MAG: hypothetical protein HZA54_02970 [Planctomycetes bacterium]|nr:hypothetical protein [Planctomycetota bacterium]
MRIADLDADEIRRAVDTAVAAGRLRGVRGRKLEDLLRGLGLMVRGKLINAAVALFGKSPDLQAHYPQMAVRLGRFRGTDRLADLADNRQFWGHAFELLGRAESFVLDHLPIAGNVPPGRMRREDQPAYAPRALREALANAFCHRDYSIGGGAVTVALYDDRLEIANPGALHFGLTPEKLLRPHESRPWNPVIAEVFHRTEVIERYGSGTLNMVDWCGENGNPPPVWRVEAGTVTVSFAPRPGAAGASAAPRWSESWSEWRKGSVAYKALFGLRPGPKSRSELVAVVGHKTVTRALRLALKDLLKAALVEYTMPSKPNSRLQKYALTARGRAWLETRKG